MKIQLTHKFEDIISLDNLLEAWREFLKGKKKKKDVQEFSLRLMDNIISLHQELVHHTYKHGGYQAFNIQDPKPRNIHKASVRDRLLHRAIYRKLYPFFDKTFISDSFSCRISKGTHKALSRFYSLALKVSKNNTKTCWVLKCDIKKFFASIDHDILIAILRKYIRYADDFVLLSKNKGWLEEQAPVINNFLQRELRLSLHSQKVFIKTLSSGIDFLGWVHFPDHRVLRTATRKRMRKKIGAAPKIETVNSYLGLLKHGNTQKLKRELVEAHFK